MSTSRSILLALALSSISVLALPHLPRQSNSTSSTANNANLPTFATIPDEIVALQAATSDLDRQRIIAGSKNLALFDFLDEDSYLGGGKDGNIVLADETNFPAVIGNDIAISTAYLGPCGMIAPHLHPRSSELFINVAGPDINIASIAEGGATPFVTTAGTGVVSILPQGATHYVQNSGCTPNLLVMGYNNQRPGYLYLTDAFTSFDAETFEAAFGVDSVQMVTQSQIPTSINLGTLACQAKCGITDNSTFSTTAISKKNLQLMALAGYLDSQGYDWRNGSTPGWMDGVKGYNSTGYVMGNSTKS